MTKPPRHVVWSWAALTALLLATLGLAYVPLGRLNVVVALAIAVVKALIVACIFMELARGASLRWLFAGAGFIWLLFLYGLSLSDYLTRRGWP